MKSLKRFKPRTYVVAGIIVLVAVLAIFAFRNGSSSSAMETALVVNGDVIERVSVTGKVLPIQKADLAFEKGGSVSKIFVKVGDEVKKGDAIAALVSASDRAALAAAEAKLDDLKRVLRPEELSAERAKVDSALTELDNAKEDAVIAAGDGYVKAQGAVVNYADAFFDNPQSVNPTINIRTQSSSAKKAVEEARLSVTAEFLRWKSDLGAATSTDGAMGLLSRAASRLSTIKMFLDSLSVTVNDLNPGNSGLAQTTIDTYVANVNSALSALNQAISSVSTARSALANASAAYEEANKNFTLANAGSSAEAIKAEQATVASLRAELDKDTLVAPIGGTITRAEPDQGEFVAAGETVFAVQSYGIYKVETYVPEADIAKITANNPAEITLDAYGPETVFAALVATIDPAETIQDGVPTYKVTLHFTGKDDRIRSGMTANTDILTAERNGVLVVPTRAVINEDGKYFARVLRSDGKNYDTVPVKIGLKGSLGMTEIVSGLSEGQRVVTYVK